MDKHTAGLPEAQQRGTDGPQKAIGGMKTEAPDMDVEALAMRMRVKAEWLASELARRGARPECWAKARQDAQDRAATAATPPHAQEASNSE